MTNRRHSERVLAEVVERILRNPSEPGSIDDLANHVGYTRRQLERMFDKILQESPREFRTRIRLEMAWWLCAQGTMPIHEVAQRVGFESASGFSRAFRSQWGCSPKNAHGPAPKSRTENPIRWVPEWASPEVKDRWNFRGFGMELARLPAMRLVKYTVVGSYSDLGDAWLALHKHLIPTGFDLRKRRCFTRYVDTLWTYPDRKNLKAHLYIELSQAEPKPIGGEAVAMPQRLCIQTMGFLRRNQRNDAWLQVLAAWHGYTIGLDEYGNSPVPWDDVTTRICLVFGTNQYPPNRHQLGEIDRLIKN